MRIAGSIAAPSLNEPSNDPYIPIHTNAARYFFNADNYKSISNKFESQRPLQPKQSVEDPLRVIQNTIAEYGAILKLRKAMTNAKSHPALIQKEAIELLEFKDAYIRYTGATEGEYNERPDAPDDAGPDNSAPSDKKDTKKPQITDGSDTAISKYGQIDQVDVDGIKNVNPLSAGEEISDPHVSGQNNSVGRDHWMKNSGLDI
jgi:hypothetical protein